MTLDRIVSLLARLVDGSGGSTRVAIVTETTLNDSGGNEAVKTTATTSAVNEFTVTNAATGNAPLISASGGDTNVGFLIAPKGTAGVVVDGPFVSKRAAATISTAGAGTYSAANIAGGIILRDPAGASRTDTTGTAADILAQFLGAKAGSSFFLLVRNTADAAETITVAGGAGVTISGTATIAQNNSKLFCGLFTNVGSGTEALTLYSIGTMVH